MSKNMKGQSLVEFIVAVGILVIVAGGGTIAIIGSLAANQRSKARIQALGYVNEGMEAAKSIRNQDWENLAVGTYGLDDSAGYWSLTSSPELIGDRYSRTITIEDAQIGEDSSGETKKITSSVTWSDTPSETKEVTSNIYLSNWRTARAAIPGGPAYGTCDDYCKSIGYSEGDCWAFPLFCWLYGRDYIPYGCQFCLGGFWDDTCCCKD